MKARCAVRSMARSGTGDAFEYQLSLIGINGRSLPWRFGIFNISSHSHDLTPDRALRRLVDKVFAQHRIKRTTAFEVSNIQPAMQFVANGLGVAVVPSAVAI